MKKFLYVDSAALPEYFIKVLEAKKLLEADAQLNVSEVTRQLGVSRSTFYKYKDCVFETQQSPSLNCATFMLTLRHETGVLSNVLGLFSEMGASILTISQTLPVNDSASVLLTADISSAESGTDEMISRAQELAGVKLIKLISLS